MDDSMKERRDVELLRKAAADSESGMRDMLSAETLSDIVSSLVSGLPLQYAAKVLDPSGDEKEACERVLDIVVEYGTWLSRTYKSAPGRPYVLAPEGVQLQLFAAHTRSTAKSERAALIVPRGYEALAGPRPGSGKSGLNSVLTLLHYQPGADEAARYLHIERRRRERAMSFDMLAAVWGFASRGRLDDMLGLGGDPRFVRLSVEAYELLETYRQDAVRGLVRLVGPESPDMGEVPELVTRCVWLAEGPLGRLSKAASIGDVRALASETSSVSQRVRSRAILVPSRVGEMSAGQVRRIGHLSGLLDESSTFQEEREIRSRLRSMGFGKDAERLSADALAASRAGNIDLFWEAMDARSEGDMSWSDVLSEAVSGG